MNGIVHPFSGALYERHDGGTIKVSLKETWGIFATNGRHIDGPLRECDPQLCGWVGGPQISNYRVTSSNTETTP
jgi:hypothetical protein